MGAPATRTTPVDISGKFGLTGDEQLGIPGTQIVPGIPTFDLTTAVSHLDPIGTTLQNPSNGAYAGIGAEQHRQCLYLRRQPKLAAPPPHT